MTAVFAAATLTSAVVRMAENLTILNVFILLASVGEQEISLALFCSRMLGHRIYIQSYLHYFRDFQDCMSLCSICKPLHHLSSLS